MPLVAEDWAAVDTVLTEVRRHRPETVALLAQRIIPGYNITPALRRISDALTKAIVEPDQRVIITAPPRTGKSWLISRAGVLFALARNPDTNIILASYADTLAQEHSHAARSLLADHGDLLGFGLRRDKTAVGRWLIDGHAGGLLAGGILSGLTGFGAGCIFVDDPVKNAQEADSEAHRRRIYNEFRSTLMTRLHPGGSVVILLTRWHEKDLAGQLLEEEPDRWTHINIPAVAESGVPDALEREYGKAMTSALGRTADEFASLRKTVGARTWYALFQGVPTAPEGGLVKRDWLNDWRMDAAPLNPTYTVVAVDPSDSGQGDSCGIVAVSAARGVAALIADKSAPMTSDEWARVAVRLAVAVGASEIAVEGFSARETYSRVVKEALAREKVGRPIKVSMWPPKGRARVGDAVARSAAMLQALEVGTLRLAGVFPDFEAKAVAWQAGQHQPDSLAALVIGHDMCVASMGQAWNFAAPGSGSGSVASLGWARQRLG